jgi:hypothetical protein
MMNQIFCQTSNGSLSPRDRSFRLDFGMKGQNYSAICLRISDNLGFLRALVVETMMAMILIDRAL